MSARSTSVHLAVQRLSAEGPVPLVVRHLPRSREWTDTTNQPPLYVRIGTPLPVAVESNDGAIVVRGNLEKLSWALYDHITSGLRKVIAGELKTEPEELAMDKVLILDAGQAMQCVQIAIPAQHGQDLARPEAKESVETYLHVLSGKPMPEDFSDSGSSVAKAIECAREVRDAIGGKTLPAACTITLPGHEESMQLAGKLGDKPDRPPSEPEELVFEGRVDGYITSQRVVHLLPAGGAAKQGGRKVVAFNEEKWFDRIAALAARRGQVVRVTYRRVLAGTKELLQLVDVTTAANHGVETH